MYIYTNNLNMFHNLPVDVQRLVYEFDSTYHQYMRKVHANISCLSCRDPNFNRFDNAIFEFGYDTMLVSDSLITTRKVNYLHELAHSATHTDIPQRLNDGYVVLLDSPEAVQMLLRSNLLREYEMDGWRTSWIAR